MTPRRAPKSLATVAALALLAAGCETAGTTTAAPPTGATTTPAAAAAAPTAGAGGFDGVYRGALSTVLASNTNCAPDGTRTTITVRNGTATMPWQRGAFTGAVGADGALDANSAFGGRLSGRFAGGEFTGTYGSRFCQYNVAARRGG